MKKGQSNVTFKKASDYKEDQKQDDDDDSPTSKNDKLINIVYADGEYHIFEPQNKEQNKYNIIDNHIWYITKFMPNVF